MCKKDDKPFKLVSIFGLHRGWTVIIGGVVIFLLLGILPSFFHMGRRVYFTSSYYPFALQVDDKDMYLCPGDVYLKPGNHKAVLHINGKTIAECSFKIRPSLFYSWLFEGKKKVHVNVDDVSVEKVYDDILDFFLNDAALYATVFEETPTSQIRNIYSDIKTELPSDLYEKALPLINLSSRLISSEYLKNDAEQNGVKTNFHKFNKEIVKSVRIHLETTNLEKKQLYRKEFIGSNGVFISKDMISESDFSEFLDENPNWNIENLDTLIKEDKVDNFYMEGFTMSETKPIVNVPLSVARAYATWFSKKYNVNATLPSSDILVKFKNALTHNENSEWEFTSTVFENASFNDGKQSDFSVFERYGIPLSRECVSLNAINTASDDKLEYSVGVAFPYLSYPNVGFRLMIKEGGNYER